MDYHPYRRKTIHSSMLVAPALICILYIARYLTLNIRIPTHGAIKTSASYCMVYTSVLDDNPRALAITRIDVRPYNNILIAPTYSCTFVHCDIFDVIAPLSDISMFYIKYLTSSTVTKCGIKLHILVTVFSKKKKIFMKPY